MKSIIILFVAITSFNTYAQKDTAEKSPLTISGYAEVYYIYDFGNPSDHNRPDFIYSFNRHNEVNLNLGFIEAEYSKDNVRGKLALMVGTYAVANLSAEDPIFRHLFEGYVGFKLSKKKNLWIDAGIMPSHIGFESAIGKNNWNMTRSILADNSPYYESGVKISYTSDNERWFLSALYLNGWQRIRRIPGNQTPAFGTQLTYYKDSKIILNWSTFVGNEQPDTSKQWRYFNNFYGQFALSQKIGLIAGFDIGAEQEAESSSDYNIWYSPVLILRIAPTSKTAIAARAEYYSDEDQVIVSTGTPNGFQTFGYSVNFDYQISQSLLWRIEARTFNSRQDRIFMENGSPSRNNYFAGSSLAISF